MATVNAFTGEDGRVRFRDPETGELGWVAPDKLAEATGEGLVPVAPDEHFAAERQAKFDAPVTAAAAGLARGATLGLSDVALTESGLVEPETLRGLEEVNPTASTVGDVGGSIASAFVPGGAVGVASRLAARGATRLATKLGTSAAGKALAGGAKLTARGVAEGTVVGAGQQVSDVALSEKDISATEAVDRIARGALQGAAVGAVADLGFAGLGGAAKLAGRGVRRLARAGSAPTQQAKAAKGLLSMLEGADATLGAGDLVRMQRERAGLAQLLPRLRKRAAQGGDDAAEVFNDVQLRVKELNKGIGDAQKDLLGLSAKAKPGAKGRGRPVKLKLDMQRTKRALKEDGVDPFNMPDIAEGQIERKLAAGKQLDPHEEYAVLFSNSKEILEQEDHINVAISRLRSENRRLLSGDEIVDDAANLARAAMDERREVLRSAVRQVRTDMQQLRRGMFRDQGDAIISASIPEAEARRLLKKGASAPLRSSGRERAALGELAESKAPALERLLNSPAMGALRQESESTTAGWAGRFTSWLSAPTILGMALGGPLGAVGGALATNPAIQQIAVAGLLKAGNLAVKIAPTAATAARVGAVKLGAISMAHLREQITAPVSDPHAIWSDAFEGYTDSGMPRDAAMRMADLQSDRVALLREYLPASDTPPPAERSRYERIVQAAQFPRGISARIAEGRVTEEDMIVLGRIAPSEHGEVQLAAQRALAAAHPGELTPSQKRQLQIMAGDHGAARHTAATVQRAAFPKQEAQAQTQRGVPQGPALTPAESAANSLGG